MNRIKTPLYIIAIMFVAFTAWAVRSRALNNLPIDYDEDDYLRAGQEYAHLFRTSNWSGFLETNYRPEHPPLAKIAYGIVFSFLPEQPLAADVSITSQPASSLPEDLFDAARTATAIFGTLTVALLAIVNPLGGLFLAIHTFTIKYTSQVMLDGLSALLSLSAILAYVEHKKRNQSAWFIASAILLGFAADSKYLHGTVGFAILVDWLISSKEFTPSRKIKSLLPILGWGLLSLAIFFAANPYFWPDPIGRLQESFSAVTFTTTNSNVTNAGYPFWQQLNWLMMSVPWRSEPPAFVFMLDTFIAMLAVFGFKSMWERNRVFALWLAIDILVLIVWRTKWPQYILIVTAPLSLSAAEGVRVLWNNLLTWWNSKRSKAASVFHKTESRRALPWLTAGLIAFAIFTIFPMLFQIAISTTDFNVTSIRDGFQGGIWRTFWNGITGQIPITPLDTETHPSQVNFTGLTSYPQVFNFIAGAPSGHSILFFNIMWTFLSVILQGVLGVFVSLLLWQRGVRLGKFWQALFILPWAIPEMVGALMWLNIFNPETGWLALAVKSLGPNIPFAFLNGWENTPSLWLIIYLLPAIWYGFPFMMLAASTGLKMIPHEVYDAASIDGASPLQTFRYVTWPLLLPLLLPAIVVRGIFAFNQFYLFQAFYYQDATLATLSYNIFNPTGFGITGQFAVSAVINIITVLILIIFVFIFNRWSKADEGVVYA
ncbi:MAG: ABC transporter permease subunit [Chloroflexi bacterium]|nr:ABC transporter permease subunit [Chloroflexota bacterium]